MTTRSTRTGKSIGPDPRQREPVVGHMHQLINMGADLAGPVALVTQDIQIGKCRIARSSCPARNRAILQQAHNQIFTFLRHRDISSLVNQAGNQPHTLCAKLLTKRKQLLVIHRRIGCDQRIDGLIQQGLTVLR